ncbi:MAG: sulfotransferase family protein [Fimbriiglobus sp.]
MTTPETRNPKPETRNPIDPKPETRTPWAPRLWEGLDYFAFWKLMVQNRFAVEPKYAYIAGIMSCVTFGNTVLRWFQSARYQRQIDEVKLTADPTFVLGHWRTGTTLLHELLHLDERFSTPTTHDCFNPCHCLLSDDLFKKHLRFLLPEKRPMDNMPSGWERPQEEEFALALLGQPSTYTDIAFPNRPPLSPGALDLSGLTDAERRRWQRTLLGFVKTLAVRDPRPLLLKSPPHTARIPELLSIFPKARFVHIRRNPYTLFASTMKLWLALAQSHGLQTPKGGAALEAKVFREFRVMMTRYLATKSQIPPGQLVEIRYEDLIPDIVSGVKSIYDGWNWDGFERVRPRLEEYVARNKDYQTNRFEIPASLRAKITHEWGDLIQSLGYPLE